MLKYLYSPQPTEQINLTIESSLVWEVILGISGYTHTRLRHTFEFDEEWTIAHKSMPEQLVKSLALIEKTNFWFALILLQDKLSSLSIQDFSNQLQNIAADCFYEILLPYKNRETEAIRKETSAQYNNPRQIEKYAKYFNDHEYLGGYIRNLAKYSHKDLCNIFTTAMFEWHNWVCKNEKWDKWMQALDFEQKRFRSINMTDPIEKIEQITGGVKYQLEPSVWTVKLIPHVSYRPWVLEKRTCHTKLFFYPLNEEHLLEPGVPSVELVRGYKALGDELRLKLLYQLLKGPSALQDLSLRFNLSKTTLHHQLSILKAARFIKVDKGIYSANPTELNYLTEKLTQYLENQK